MIKLTGLDLMKRDDDVLEEFDMLLSQRYCETTNDGGVDIKEFWDSVESESLMDESMEIVVHCPTDHFTSWDEFGVQSMEDIFEIFSLPWFFRVKKL